jgi:hypothetical protein
MTTGSRPVVVHLVRAANDYAAYERFIESLRLSPPGDEYDFVLAMKGFASSSMVDPYLRAARHLGPEVVFLSDHGYDLNTYFEVVRRIGPRQYCFLNSYSVVLAPGWLASMRDAHRLADVGLVGATGSWASQLSQMLLRWGAPSAYREIFGSRKALDVLAQVDREGTTVTAHPRPDDFWHELTRYARHAPKFAVETIRQVLWFERFPARHIRTNAFMIDGAFLMGLQFPDVSSKTNAYRIESGRRSLTHQILSRGSRAVVVDKHGILYDADQWHLARTFWQGDQEGLLVADNQTRKYDHGSPVRRRTLAQFAWGSYADPIEGSARRVASNEADSL